MPILSDLSRRFFMLTTDAKPDPPRVVFGGQSNDLPTENESKTKSRSASTSEDQQRQRFAETPTLQRQKSTPNEATPLNETDFTRKEAKFNDASSSASDSKEFKRPSTKTKSKSKQNRQSQSINVVNYNIVNSKGVKIGARTSYICNISQFPTNDSTSSEANSSKPKSKLMPEDVESLSTCKDEITLEDMFIIKTHIGHGWKDVARRLSYSDGQIEQFEENYRHKGIDEVIYQLLLDWKQTKTTNARIGTLLDILWLSQEYDCAERVARAHKDLS